MSEAAPDADLMDRFGFPGPPHRIGHSRSGAVLAAGYVAMALLFGIGVAILVAYFGFSPVGRGLVVDSLLAAGVGEPLPGAAVALGGCDYHGTRAGSKLPGSWRCEVTVVADGERMALAFETNQRIEDPRPRGAGRVLGQTGVYWGIGMLAARWWSATVLAMIGGGLIALAVATFRWSFEARRLRRARRGRVRAVDLLTGQGRVWFAFADAGGTRRFQRADNAAEPLMLDSLHTVGVAVVTGEEAVLLSRNLMPLEVEAARRETIYAQVAEAQRQSQVRRALAPQPGDPPTLAERIEAIERGLKGKPDAAALAALYDAAWRLVWDGDDAAIAARALAARDAIARRLGPAAAWAVLDNCRRRYGAGAH